MIKILGFKIVWWIVMCSRCGTLVGTGSNQYTTPEYHGTPSYNHNLLLPPTTPKFTPWPSTKMACDMLQYIYREKHLPSQSHFSAEAV
jgi:hypothetical protein